MSGDGQSLCIDYRLPVTAVTFLGDVTTSTSSLASATTMPTVARTGTALAAIVADPRQNLTLEVPYDDLKDIAAEIALTVDGRLTSFSNEVTDRRGEWLVSLAKTVVGTSALGFAIGGPVGLAAGAVAGALAVATEETIDSHIDLVSNWRAVIEKGQPVQIVTPPEETPLTDEDITKLAHAVKVDPRYRADRPEEFAKLVLYRHALLRAQLRHAAAGFRGDDHGVEAVHASIKTLRREATAVEASYADWLASKATLRTVRHEFRLFVDQLPTERELHNELAERASQHKDVEAWWPIVTTLGLIMTCDLDLDLNPDEPGTATSGGKSNDRLHVKVRRPVPARLATWKISRSTAAGQQPEWIASLQDVSRVLVVHPNFQVSLRPFAPGAQSKTAYELSADGGIAKLTIGTTAQRAERAAQIQAIIESATTARSEALKARLTELETRSSIAKLTDPAAPDKDPLQDLRAKVSRAELEARALVAQEIAAHPSMVMVTVQQTTSS